MKTRHKFTATTAALAACVSFALLSAVQADTLTFTNASASSVAAAMNKRYGVTIVFRGSINKNQPVTFSVDDPDTSGGRLAAVSSLAGALDVDFQKVYVVSKVDPGAAVPSIPMDSNGPVVFQDTRVPVRDAIQTVAAVDNALTQISPAVDGTVVFSDTHLTAPNAAASIAKQTGTEWKAYYGLFKRSEMPARLGGIVVGQTATGQPITELPLLSYRQTRSVTVPLHSGEDAVVGPFTPQFGNPDVSSVPSTDVSGFDQFSYGDPYGYTNPLGSYGYAAPNGAFAVPGSVYTPGGGVSPVMPGVNAPPANAAAGSNGAAVPIPVFPSGY